MYVVGMHVCKGKRNSMMKSGSHQILVFVAVKLSIVSISCASLSERLVTDKTLVVAMRTPNHKFELIICPCKKMQRTISVSNCSRQQHLKCLQFLISDFIINRKHGHDITKIKNFQTKPTWKMTRFWKHTALLNFL